ncbi:YigZ family protein [Treponema phagedenis]|uniref:Putative YigZ family protein n=1 Tax=Treponema phagedenis TaxID=162 RepID=A0A0B7GW02_TREPH|nr:YigZ family protein [Treponema phagedenis]NVP25279.1 YigZ family protein [Treponema phagedenis]QEK02004.1 YigZ family protein [Treponema phagedenis]QLC59967.1 YigZ family protein [Treponema phagedenis]QSH95617.1 YigZ family protein [Treponema phagedenis]QSH98832.1 YigZ family protein [Treponema phagedenis]
MRELIEYAFVELKIKNSRFLAECFPIKTQAEVRELLKAQKQKYADSTHVVHAFVCGDSAEILGCSDDGEPAGTAGKPALAVLKGSGITNIFVTITRWFGGTLLGTGGLVKAYGDMTKAVLEVAKTEEIIEYSFYEFTCSYADYEFLKRHFERFQTSPQTEFGQSVRMIGKIPSIHKEAFSLFVKEATKGTALIRWE